MRQDRRRRRVIWIIAAVLLIVVLVAVFWPRPPAVRTAEVFRGDLVLDLSSTGVVEGNVADISARIVGRIDEILVEEGDEVESGQVVAMLDSSELQADVDRAQAAVSSASAQAAAASQSLNAERSQANSQLAGAQAALSAARARLAEVEAGARPQEIAQAQAAVDQAASQARIAQADLERARQLYEQGAISRSQLDQAVTAADVAQANLQAARERLALVREGARSEQIDAARAEVRAAEAGVAQARSAFDLVRAREEEVRAAQAQARQAQSALEAAQARLALATIRSPITGTIVRRHVEQGETVAPQQPILTAARNEPIWVTAEVDQEDVAAVEVGQQVRITLDAYPGRYAEGTVTDVSPVAVPKEVGRVRARVVRARISVDESDIPLRPGIEVYIDGSRRVAEDVILVPNEAVLRLGDEDIVYVIEGQYVHRRTIVTGLSSFDYTIVEQGLNIGEEVAISNLDDLSDGMRVRVIGTADEQ